MIKLKLTMTKLNGILYSHQYDKNNLMFVFMGKLDERL